MNQSRNIVPRGKRRDHQWVTVINPTNSRLLLQACDNCGVVKSENSIARRCQQPNNQHIISYSRSQLLQQSA